MRSLASAEAIDAQTPIIGRRFWNEIAGVLAELQPFNVGVVAIPAVVRVAAGIAANHAVRVGRAGFAEFGVVAVARARIRVAFAG